MQKTTASTLIPAMDQEAPVQPLLKVGALQKAIFNSANFCCIATDTDGVIQIFNVGAERMLGYKAVDVVNRATPADLSDFRELEARATALSQEFEQPITAGFEAMVFKARRSIEDIYELTYACEGGGRLPAIVSVTALRDDYDILIGYLLISTDNTGRKRMEAARDLAQSKLDAILSDQHKALEEKNFELESARAIADKANMAKSEFMSGMSHELRTPLNAVLGFAQLMESATPSPSPAQKLSIEQILKGGWYLLHLINEILDLAMIESGKLAMSQEAMSLSDVLQDCEVLIQPQAQKRGIGMTFPPPDSACYVHADPTRVKQVIINLLSNAIKYNRINGTVVVECLVDIPGRVRVSVRDTGAGLSPAQLEQLYQPFNRLGKENGAEEGTGVGLVVTKQLVELMGGTVGVESVVGVGTTFWIELPSCTAPQRQASGEVAATGAVKEDLATPTPSPLRTLLYVEDNPANLALVEQLIARRKDLKFLMASDANTGLDLARTHQPQVILMDINLPGMSGYDALKILHLDPATAHIPVLALSANAIPRDIQKGLDAGFFRYLTKPIKLDEFADALDGALRHAEQNTGLKAIA
ncbi:MAG: Hybrid sensor histidine kinase/response regulator [Herminiimonas sp.]|nr:Hybrid sensor histidine kinase/response regulator [Herminiimonas sp.]MDB5853702.1 Hybrid sensor histidine kinase/response regulator [Herminiimonas sp.]